VNTAALLADAMTDYVLTAGVNRAAPAAGTPEHIAAWLEARGYRVVHRMRSTPRAAVLAGECPVDHETGAGGADRLGSTVAGIGCADGRFASVLEVEMLNRDEHDTLRQIELNMAAADPRFASLLRNGQRRLLRSRHRKLWRRSGITLFLLLAYALLMLGLPSSALALGVLAATGWWLRRWPIAHQF
jgi:hypothetical protein